jgi:hypothetical protein
VESSAIGRVLGWTAIAATLAISPWATYDPINVPKLAVIAVGGLIALAALLINAKSLFARKHRTVQVLAGLFVLDLIVVLIFAGTNPYQEFFGTFGRSTGFLAYFALTALFIGAVVIASTKFIGSFARTLLIAGGLSIGYGFLQIMGADPFKWVNQYSPVIGFLGNPNFQSSFVGFNGIAAFAVMIGSNNNWATFELFEISNW